MLLSITPGVTITPPGSPTCSACFTTLTGEAVILGAVKSLASPSSEPPNDLSDAGISKLSSSSTFGSAFLVATTSFRAGDGAPKLGALIREASKSTPSFASLTGVAKLSSNSTFGSTFLVATTSFRAGDGAPKLGALIREASKSTPSFASLTGVAKLSSNSTFGSAFLVAATSFRAGGGAPKLGALRRDRLSPSASPSFASLTGVLTESSDCEIDNKSVDDRGEESIS